MGGIRGGPCLASLCWIFPLFRSRETSQQERERKREGEREGGRGRDGERVILFLRRQTKNVSETAGFSSFLPPHRSLSLSFKLSFILE